MELKNLLIDKIGQYIKDGSAGKNIEINKDFRIEFLAQGEYNINFIIYDKYNKYVFRVNTGSQLGLSNQIEYEYNALKALEVSSVTPRVYFVDDSKNYFDFGILIMEFLEGRPLEYDRDLKKAAGIFGRIHTLDLSKIETGSFIIEENIFTARVKEARGLLKDFLLSDIISERTKGFFQRFLDYAVRNCNNEKYFIEDKWHVINNTEVNSRNFIIGDEKSYLIDWEKPAISDPCQDLTQFLAPTTTLWKTDYVLSGEEREDFFKEYVKAGNGFDKDIRERVRLYTPYLYLRALSWCAYAYLEYQNPNKGIKNMETLQKIEQYLKLDFMEDLLKEYF